MSDLRKLLHDNDTRFVNWAGQLSDADWQQPSLCTEWRNHDVLAHLVVGYRASGTELGRYLFRHRGSFDRANKALSTDVARRRSPAALLDEFSTLIRRPRGVGRVFPRRLLLGDHVIHELDIALALNRPPEVTPEALVAVLNTQVRVPNPFVPAAARARGLRLCATDVDWTHGVSAPTVTGGAADLASVLAGRPYALERLRGSGVDELRDRLARDWAANPGAG
ncbi:maleylpyruvate isomerase family mycothiol-dependent enzyme [Mycobacterium asiaticum]|uniref:Mycothiol-dependent maleylpyruvate isomerase metal-binding domain-containing protein n=1 Tax=Mycobacterium asiaticum TaxID=1790 RepID=A0A1A3KY70_MYCAS|nr:maleylpyruvate isomerase family mycothiol-dependent enzyme [Mycobacterium asiaticum]OBJ88881.1 hypothetical protein A5640_04060 [Mycobacterium asiaticum]